MNLCRLASIRLLGAAAILLVFFATYSLEPTSSSAGMLDAILLSKTNFYDVNVMFAVGGPDVFAVGGCVRSIFANTKHPLNRVCIHVAVSTEEERKHADTILRQILSDVPELCLHVAIFDFFPDYRWMYDTRPDLYAPVNYARYYVERLFPSVQRMIYLDYDTVVQGDIADLFNTDMQGYGLAAVENCEFELRMYLDLNFDHPYINGRYDPAACSFVAGVLLLDINYWRAHSILSQLEEAMAANLRAWPSYIYERGSQSPLILVFNGRYVKLDKLWQVNDLGWMSPKAPSDELLEKGKILHWNGRHKPWLSYGLYVEKWRPYFPNYTSYLDIPAPSPPPVRIFHDIPMRQALQPLNRQGVLILGATDESGAMLVEIFRLFGLTPVRPNFADTAPLEALMTDDHLTNGIHRLEELKAHTPWVGLDSSLQAMALQSRGVMFRIVRVFPFRNGYGVPWEDKGDTPLKAFCKKAIEGPLMQYYFGLDIDRLASYPDEEIIYIHDKLTSLHIPYLTPVADISKQDLKQLVHRLRASLSVPAPPECQAFHKHMQHLFRRG